MVGEPFRIGIVAGDVLQRWQDDALAELRADGTSIVARFSAAGDQRPNGLPRAVERLARDAAAAFDPVSWDAPAVAPASAARDLDAVLLFATPADQPALDAARFGCWEIVLPGDPPAFDAVAEGRGCVEVRIERRIRGAVTVIACAAAKVDVTSYARTLRDVISVARALPADAARRARAGVAGGEPAPSRPAPRGVGTRRVMLVAWRSALRRLATMVGRRVLHARWRIGRMHSTPAALLAGGRPEVGWLDLPRASFWADPFPLVEDGDTDVLFEGFDYARNRGYLARATLAGDRVVGRVRKLAHGEHHVSYPFVVEDGAARYVLPEQAQSGRLVLYAADGDGLREVRVLLEDFPAVDPTLFRHAGRWWLFTGDARSDPDGTLMLFHAAALAGPWLPHPLNPIVRDIRTARSAGTPFIVDGVLYRAGQDCSTSYGARVALARVDVLTVDAYRETVVAHVEPPARGGGRHGLHTFALRDGVCLIDGKDLVLDPAATWAMLRADLRRLFGAQPRASRIASAEVVLRS